MLWVLADSAVHDCGYLQADEIASKVVGGVHRGQERKGPFLGIAVALVINVVEHQAVDAHGAQALEHLRGDLTGLLRFGRQARWRQREKQELTRPLRNAPLQLHAPKRSQAPVHYGLAPAVVAPASSRATRCLACTRVASMLLGRAIGHESPRLTRTRTTVP